MLRIAAFFLVVTSTSTADMWFPNLRQSDSSSRALARNSVAPLRREGGGSPLASTGQIRFDPQNEDSAWEKHVDKVISRGILRMSLEMDTALRREGGSASANSNIVFSPVSIASALALVLLGAGGKTFEETAKVMGVASGVEIASRPHLIHEQFGRLLDKFSFAHLPSRNNFPGSEQAKNFDGLELTAASGVFVQKGIPIAPTFRRVADSAYHSDVLSVDFQGHGEEAQRIINSWVSERTNGHIHDILPWKVAPPWTRVILATALYFNGAWKFPFPPETTSLRPFYVGPYPKYVNGYPVKPNSSKEGDIIKVPLMVNAVDLPYLERPDLGFRAVGLPYGLNNTSLPVATMYVIVPNPTENSGVKDLQNLIKRLKYSDLESVVSDAKTRPVIISIPRMKLSSSTSLRGAISSLGLPSLFDPISANLTGIFEDSVTDRNVRPPRRQRVRVKKDGKIDLGPLYADDVRHRVELELTELGTVAAAATSVSLSRDGGTHKVIRADRPFLFFVHHAPSGLILFWGSVMKPPK